MKEAAEAKNRAEQLVFQTEKMIKDLGDKVPSDDKLAVENAISELKSAVEANDTQRIKTASEALEQQTYKLAQLLYGQAGQAQAAPEEEPAASPGGNGGKQAEEDEGVIDAEFKAE